MALMRSTVNRAPGKDYKTEGQDETGNVIKHRVDEPMSDVTLRNIIKEEIHTAVGFIGGDVSEDRRRAMDYYLGDRFGNEQEGRSQIVSTDVQDTIESIMPDLVEIFASGDEIARFEPSTPEDEPFTAQATDYVNHIWFNDNDGFGITHDWIKDALLQKNGVIKIYWDEAERTTRETLENINSLTLKELTDDDTVEIIEHEERPVEDPDILQFAQDGRLHDVTLLRTEMGRVTIMPVPPEEFLIARRSVSLDNAEFTCHKVRKTVSDLIEMGYDREKVENIPSHDDQDYNEERISRFDDDEWPELDDSLDPAMREIWLYECYIKVDYDGDGVTEMRQVTVAGPGYDLMDNETFDEHPFASTTTIRMPHKFFGRSLADLVEDIQLIKSTVQRQLLDNMYAVNNNRAAISSKVDLDDYLTNRPGGAIRVDTDAADVQGHIAPITTQSLGSFAYPLLEYLDNLRETRTGISRLSQGLDPDSLNKTATGINQLLGRTQKRLLLIARVMAEGGFKVAMKKILKLVVNRQDRPRVIRLRDKWVPMDPRSWNAEMDVKISVGLGYGTKEQQSMMFERILNVQERIVKAQNGVSGPLVTAQNIYNTNKKWLQSMGIKDADQHFTDPENSQIEPPEPPPDPAVIKAQMDGQSKQLEVQTRKQIEFAKVQQDERQHEDEMRLKWAEFQANAGAEERKLDIEQQKLAVDQEKADLDLSTKSRELDQRDTETAVKRDLEFEKMNREDGRVEREKSTETAEKENGQSLAKQLSEISDKLNMPKTVKIQKGKDGKVTGAIVTQGGVKSEIVLSR